jgi:hypothetical protein
LKATLFGFMVSGFMVSGFQGFIQIGVGVGIGIGIAIGIVDPRPATFDLRRSTGTVPRTVRGRLKKSVESNALWFQGFMVSGFLVSGFQGFRVSSKSGSGSGSVSGSIV